MYPKTSVSAYVPHYNAHATVGVAVDSIYAQTIPINDIFVMDDGTADQPLVSVRVIRNKTNLGRGAIRAQAMAAAQGDLVLACDATLALYPSFLEKALPWFEDDRVAAVFGRVEDEMPKTMANRWRSRHIFRTDRPGTTHHGASLNTCCSVIRKAAAEQVGGFNRALREGEDRDLGKRLLSAKFDVVFDPELMARSQISQTVLQVLDRYARWNTQCKMKMSDYLRQISYSFKVMVKEDLRARDPATGLISLLSPHYQLWYANFRSRSHGRRN